MNDTQIKVILEALRFLVDTNGNYRYKPISDKLTTEIKSIEDEWKRNIERCRNNSGGIMRK